tara:strand:+ start:579 stop:755 length:177 start_codon:yes stop_codon:yes gene_type:complete
MKSKNKKHKQRNFVVKQMVESNSCSTKVHKDKKYEQEQKIRGKKHKEDYTKGALGSFY